MCIIGCQWLGYILYRLFAQDQVTCMPHLILLLVCWSKINGYFTTFIESWLKMLGLNPHWGNHGFTNSADLSPPLPQNVNEPLSKVSQTKSQHSKLQTKIGTRHIDEMHKNTILCMQHRKPGGIGLDWKPLSSRSPK